MAATKFLWNICGWGQIIGKLDAYSFVLRQLIKVLEEVIGTAKRISRQLIWLILHSFISQQLLPATISFTLACECHYHILPSIFSAFLRQLQYFVTLIRASRIYSRHCSLFLIPSNSNSSYLLPEHQQTFSKCVIFIMTWVSWCFSAFHPRPFRNVLNAKVTSDMNVHYKTRITSPSRLLTARNTYERWLGTSENMEAYCCMRCDTEYRRKWGV